MPRIDAALEDAVPAAPLALVGPCAAAVVGGPPCRTTCGGRLPAAGLCDVPVPAAAGTFGVDFKDVVSSSGPEDVVASSFCGGPGSAAA